MDDVRPTGEGAVACPYTMVEAFFYALAVSDTCILILQSPPPPTELGEWE